MDRKRIASASIVVGIDTSRESGLALEWAADEATRQHVPLHILHAYSLDHLGAGTEGLGVGLPADDIHVLGALADRACAVAAATAHALHPDLVITTTAEAGSPGEALVAASRTAGLVVVGARGLGAVRSILLGSVSIRVAAHAQCPVVVVREAASRTLPDARVIVGVDGLESSTGAIRFAFERAAIDGLGLTVVHTWQLDSVEGAPAAKSWGTELERLDVTERSLLSQSIAGYREQFPAVDVRRHVVQRHPVDELVRLSENARMLVVGTRGRGSVRGVIEGSVSQGVLRRAHCPVAVVHPDTDDLVHGDDRHQFRLSGASDSRTPDRRRA